MQLFLSNGMKASIGLAIIFAPAVFADEPAAPFAFADFSWIPGNYGPTESALATKYFTPEVRLDGA